MLPLNLLYRTIMTYFSSDTSPEVEAIMLDRMRQMTGSEKWRMVAELNAAVRAMALAGLRQRYPHASEAELRRRLAGLLLGEELAERAYGPAPEEKSDAT